MLPAESRRANGANRHRMELERAEAPPVEGLRHNLNCVSLVVLTAKGYPLALASCARARRLVPLPRLGLGEDGVDDACVVGSLHGAAIFSL